MTMDLMKMISARDRRMAAVHEAGHLVMAARFSLYPSSAWITPIEPAGPDKRTWVGLVQFSTGLDRLAPIERSMLGCAGAVAQICWQRDYLDPDYWTDADMMSASDWRLSGCEPGKPNDSCIEAIEKLHYLLSDGGPLWSDLVREARRLIVAIR